jgi:hypothetical protein
VLTLCAFKVKKRKEKESTVDHGEQATEPTDGTVTAGVY